MRKILTFSLLLVALTFQEGDFTLFFDVLKATGYTFQAMLTLALPFLDLKQMAITYGIALVIIQVLCGVGFVVTYKTERKILSVVSGFVGVIATMLQLITLGD